MGVLQKGTNYGPTSQVNDTNLDAHVDDAEFSSDAVDNVTTELSGGSIVLRDGGVSTAKLADGAATTAKIADSNVTKAKIENLADYKVLGNVSGGSAAPAEVSILDEDTMASNSATALATQQSIKAYVDEYAMKYSGTVLSTLSPTTSFQDLDLSAHVGTNRALVVLLVVDTSGGSNDIFFKTKGVSAQGFNGGNGGWGASGAALGNANEGGFIFVVTDTSGVIQYEGATSSSGVNVTLVAYQKLM
jgi:hypothetical protein